MVVKTDDQSGGRISDQSISQIDDDDDVEKISNIINDFALSDEAVGNTTNTDANIENNIETSVESNDPAAAWIKARVSSQQLSILAAEWRDFSAAFVKDNSRVGIGVTIATGEWVKGKAAVTAASIPSQTVACKTTIGCNEVVSSWFDPKREEALALTFEPPCAELERRIANNLPIRVRPHIRQAKKLATWRGYRETNHEKIVAYNEAHRAETNQRRQEWKTQNPDKVKAAKQRERDVFYHRPFIVVDAEGRNFDGRDVKYDGAVWKDHGTILWAMGGAIRGEDGKLSDIKPRFHHNADDSQLKPRQVLDWLVDTSQEIIKEHGEVIFVSFVFDYDVTQLLKGLRRETAYEIARGRTFPKDGKSRRVRSPKFVRTSQFLYAISYRRRKRVVISRLRDPDNPYKTDDKGRRRLDIFCSLVIYDTFGFYQEVFAKVAESLVSQGLATNEELVLIKEGKENRPNFAQWPVEKIKPYTATELSLLSRAVTTLRDDGFDNMGIRLKEWSGAGSAAGALLRAMGVKAHYPTGEDAIRTRNISKSQDTAHHAFVGGRIELLKQGYAPDQPLFGYDICSAYPSIMVDLPSMNGGEFREIKMPDKATIPSSNILSRYLVRWQFPLFKKRRKNNELQYYPFYPLPYRRKDGAILFPADGYAWVMRDDLVAALKWIAAFGLKPRDYVLSVEEALEFLPENDIKPFARYAALYEQRRLMKDGPIYDIAEKAIKLALNSGYGKTAQKIGGDDFKPPGCANPHYAAATTAGTRRRMIEAALIDPDSIVMFATDGIISTRELHGLARVKDADDKSQPKYLGDWETRNFGGGGMFVQAGIYCYFNSSGKDVTKMRGVDKRNLKTAASLPEFLIGEVLPAWRKPFDYEDENSWPTVTTHQRTYMTAGSAVASPQRYRAIGRWSDTQREMRVHSIGVKREHCPDRLEFTWSERLSDGTVREAERCSRLVETMPTRNMTPDVLSQPLYPEWVDFDTEADWLSAGPRPQSEDDDDGFDDDDELDAILRERGG